MSGTDGLAAVVVVVVVGGGPLPKDNQINTLGYVIMISECNSPKKLRTVMMTTTTCLPEFRYVRTNGRWTDELTDLPRGY